MLCSKLAVKLTCKCGCMQHDYKGFSPGVTMETVTEEDWRSAPALQETPVTSAICEPANGAQLEEGTEEVPGLLSTWTNACPHRLAVLCYGAVL